jgi:hypothetical protein
MQRINLNSGECVARFDGQTFPRTDSRTPFGRPDCGVR